jgi:hypothetical protein
MEHVVGSADFDAATIGQRDRSSDPEHHRGGHAAPSARAQSGNLARDIPPVRTGEARHEVLGQQQAYLASDRRRDEQGMKIRPHRRSASGRYRSSCCRYVTILRHRQDLVRCTAMPTLANGR